MKLDFDLEELDIIQLGIQKTIKDWHTFCAKNNIDNIRSCKKLLSLQEKILVYMESNANNCILNDIKS